MNLVFPESHDLPFQGLSYQHWYLPTAVQKSNSATTDEILLGLEERFKKPRCPRETAPGGARLLAIGPPG